MSASSSSRSTPVTGALFRWSRQRIVVLLGLALAPLLGSGATAQQPVRLGALPDSVAKWVISYYNRDGIIRLNGESRIAAGSELSGDVAVLGGPVQVAGRVHGDLVVINGDLRFAPGAEVTGRVVVVGGTIAGAAGARVGGTMTAYREALRYRQDQAGLVVLPPPLEPELSAGRDFAFGRTDFLLAVRRGYNRVEGLPISVGPRIRLGHTNPTMLEGLLIYRSAAGVHPDRDQVGYDVRVEQFLGGGRTASFGARLYSEVDVIQRWGLSDREASLATFVLHRDYRDEYQREGWSGFLRLARPGWPYDLTLEYRDEENRSRAPRNPWVLLYPNQEWRPEPVVAEGSLQTLRSRLTYDTRNEPFDPSAGWYVRAELEQGLGGSLVSPELVDSGAVSFPARTAPATFTTAFVDLRRYARLSPSSRMAVRALLAGSLNGHTLPPQRQLTLGGEGTLPGFGLLQFDCGARATTGELGDNRFYPYFGCDRMVLVQLEYQANFPFARRLSRALFRDFDLGNAVRWAVFFDAGRAWIEPGARAGRRGGEDNFSADGGFGVRFGRVGAYWALPLSGSGHGLNFFIRIVPRL